MGITLVGKGVSTIDKGMTRVTFSLDACTKQKNSGHSEEETLQQVADFRSLEWKLTKMI